MSIFQKFIIILLFLSFRLEAQEHQVTLHVKNLPENSQPILLRIYNGNLIIIDSTAIKQGETIFFQIPNDVPPGMFRSILGSAGFSQFGGQPVNLDFLYNKENVELSLDFTRPQQSVEVIQSEENRIYFDFLKSDALFYQKLGLLEQVVTNYPDKDDFYQKALEYYYKFQIQREKLIEKTSSAHPKTLAGRIIKNQKVPVTKGNMTPAQRDSLFKNEFLNNVDFNDTTLLYTNVYTDKIFQYVQMFINPTATPRENEAQCIQALDKIVPVLDVNPIIQQHLLQFLIAGFESMQMEEVLAHISNNYLQQCGGASEVVQKRLEGYRKMAVGQQVPDFTLLDLQENPINLYSDLSPYTLILFWHTECSHCQQLMQQLPEICQQEYFKRHQIKIIGISIDENKENWEKFSQNYSLEWINTYTPDSFDSDIANDYNLFATPTMFLVDSEHKIIAKPTTVEELIKDVQKLK